MVSVALLWTRTRTVASSRVPPIYGGVPRSRALKSRIGEFDNTSSAINLFDAWLPKGLRYYASLVKKKKEWPWSKSF